MANTTCRLFERYFLGGINSVRGFQESKHSAARAVRVR